MNRRDRIAGGLLGVHAGVDAIPPQWTAVLQVADEFRAAAEILAS